MLYTTHATSATLGQELTNLAAEDTLRPEVFKEEEQAEIRAKGYAILLNQSEHLGATDWVGTVKANPLILY